MGLCSSGLGTYYTYLLRFLKVLILGTHRSSKLDFLMGAQESLFIVLVNALYSTLMEAKEGRGVIYNLQGQI